MKYIVEKERIYARDADGKVVAEVTFPAVEGVPTIDHTFVDVSLRGQGIAGELVRLAADRIVADGKRIAATCPYAVVWLGRHPEYPVADIGLSPSCRIDKGHE